MNLFASRKGQHKTLNSIQCRLYIKGLVWYRLKLAPGETKSHNGRNEEGFAFSPEVLLGMVFELSSTLAVQVANQYLLTEEKTVNGGNNSGNEVNNRVSIDNC